MAIRERISRIVFYAALACIFWIVLPMALAVLKDYRPVETHDPQEGVVAADFFAEVQVRGWKAIEEIDSTFWARGASTYYVDSGGSGTACSIGTPCTFQNALRKTGVLPGDMFWLNAGTYTTSSATADRFDMVNAAGTWANPVIYRNRDNGHVFIDCNANLDSAVTQSVCIGYLGAAVGGVKSRGVTLWGLDFGNSSTATIYWGSGLGPGGPPTMNAIQPKLHDLRIINCYIRYASSGLSPFSPDAPAAGLSVGQRLFYGNLGQYNGAMHHLDRGSGHGIYTQNNGIGEGTSRMTTFKDNVFFRSYYQEVHLYQTQATPPSSGGTVNLWDYTFDHNVFGPSGHGAGDDPAWPAVGGDASVILGGNGLGTALDLCQPGAAGTADVRHIRNLFFTFNVLFGDPGVLGYSKGGCDVTFTDNYIESQGPPYNDFNSLTFGINLQPPLTFLRNYVESPWPSGMRPGAVLSLTPAHYPGNTYGAIATGKYFMYRPNEYETGRGFVTVHNRDLSASVNIQLVNTAAPGVEPNGAGVFVGENYRVFNWQCADFWNCPTVAAAQCLVSPCTISVPSTLAAGSILQPHFTQLDGVTPMPKPLDLGPERVVFVVVPDWSAGATPTPTTTPSPTNTVTNTPTETFTQTFTPSRTPTFTRTPTGTIVATLTPSNTQTPTRTFTPSNTPTITPTPSGGGSGASFAVAQCAIGAPAAVTVTTEFPGSYVTSASGNNGIINCPFTVPNGGLYRVWVKTYGGTANTDSTYISVDSDNTSAPENCLTDGTSACTHIFDVAEAQQPCTGITSCEYFNNIGTIWWNQLNDRTSTCGDCTGNFTERQLTLTGGPHMISFRIRSAGTRLYYVIVTSDMDYTPVDPAPTPTPAPVPTGIPSSQRHSHTCESEVDHKTRTGWHTHAGGNISHTHIPCPWQPAP